MEKIKYTAEKLINRRMQVEVAKIESIKNTSALHNHDFYEFFLITKGRVVHNINNKLENLKQGDLVFIRPEDSHCYEYYGEEDCSFININFSKEVIEEAFSYFGDSDFRYKMVNEKFSPFINLEQQQREILVKNTERIGFFLKTNNFQGRTLGRGLLIEIFGLLFEVYQKKITRELPIWLNKLLVEMENKENFIQGLDKMCILGGKSQGHINRVFKKYFNMTPTTYINNLRLNYAKNLLISTNESIMEVSLQAGFENLSHFYHLFIKVFGLTPGEMKK